MPMRPHSSTPSNSLQTRIATACGTQAHGAGPAPMASAGTVIATSDPPKQQLPLSGSSENFYRRSPRACPMTGKTSTSSVRAVLGYRVNNGPVAPRGCTRHAAERLIASACPRKARADRARTRLATASAIQLIQRFRNARGPFLPLYLHRDPRGELCATFDILVALELRPAAYPALHGHRRQENSTSRGILYAAGERAPIR